MYKLFDPSGTYVGPGLPPLDATVAYYYSRAPENLASPLSEAPLDASRNDYEHLALRPTGKSGAEHCATTPYVAFVSLFDDQRRDLLVVDWAADGKLLVVRADADPPRLEELASIGAVTHAQVVDFDHDGLNDLLVASQGQPMPSEERTGSVIWLRQDADGTFEPHTIAENLPRIADARASDFDGDGDADIVVAAFGYLQQGMIAYYENITAEDGAPEFEPSILDTRAGATHVVIADLDNDGDDDFVALIAQEHETVVAFMNDGVDAFPMFRKRPLFAADHPGWGCCGIEVVDLDGDGDLDVTLINGDTLDNLVVKPYHGIGWLENLGDLHFEYRPLHQFPGVYCARTGDLDGDGDLDLVACSWLPVRFRTSDLRPFEKFDSLVWLEQTAPREFQYRVLEKRDCIHPGLDLGDFDGDGTMDIAVGNFPSGVFYDALCNTEAGSEWVRIYLAKGEEPPVVPLHERDQGPAVPSRGEAQ